MAMNFYPPYRNVISTVISSGDICSMSVAVIDAAGNAVSLTKEGPGGIPIFRDLFWTFRNKTTRQEFTYTIDDYVTMENPELGHVSIEVPAGILYDTWAFDHWLRAAWPDEEEAARVLLALGRVDIKRPEVARNHP